MATELRTDAVSLATDARSVARGLHRLVEGDLAGMFDGESTATVDWSGPGIVVDLSAVLQSPAFSSILVCAGAWLAQVVARKTANGSSSSTSAGRPSGRRLRGLGEETQKLSRGYGVQFVTIVQRISDLASQADDGTATAKRPRGRHRSRDQSDLQPVRGRGPGLPGRHGLDRVGASSCPGSPGDGRCGGSVSTAPSSRPSCRPGHRHVRQQSGHAARQQPGSGGPPVTVGKAPRVTWSRLGIALSIGLVVFGVVDASLPHSTLPAPRFPVGPTPARTLTWPLHGRSRERPCRCDQCR